MLTKGSAWNLGAWYYGEKDKRFIYKRPKSGSEKNDKYKYGWIQVIHVDTKIKALGFLNIHDNNFNTCGGMILEMISKKEIHTSYT